eukprot:8937364-Pyramimonas_sp.AAC.1
MFSFAFASKHRVEWSLETHIASALRRRAQGVRVPRGIALRVYVVQRRLVGRCPPPFVAEFSRSVIGRCIGSAAPASFDAQQSAAAMPVTCPSVTSSMLWASHGKEVADESFSAFNSCVPDCRLHRTLSVSSGCSGIMTFDLSARVAGGVLGFAVVPEW